MSCRPSKGLNLFPSAAFAGDFLDRRHYWLVFLPILCVLFRGTPLPGAWVPVCASPFAQAGTFLPEKVKLRKDTQAQAVVYTRAFRYAGKSPVKSPSKDCQHPCTCASQPFSSSRQQPPRATSGSSTPSTRTPTGIQSISTQQRSHPRRADAPDCSSLRKQPQPHRCSRCELSRPSLLANHELRQGSM